MPDYLLGIHKFNSAVWNYDCIEGGVTNASPGCEAKSLKIGYLPTRAGIRLKLSNVVLIKFVHYCKIINKTFVRQKSDFHVHVFFMSKGVQLAGPKRARAQPS